MRGSPKVNPEKDVASSPTPSEAIQGANMSWLSVIKLIAISMVMFVAVANIYCFFFFWLLAPILDRIRLALNIAHHRQYEIHRSGNCINSQQSAEPREITRIKRFIKFICKATQLHYKNHATYQSKRAEYFKERLPRLFHIWDFRKRHADNLAQEKGDGQPKGNDTA